MPAKPWAELSADAKADELREQLAAFDEREQQNILERAYRFRRIEQRLDSTEAMLKDMAARLAKLEAQP
jgi:hypothetical protein